MTLLMYATEIAFGRVFSGTVTTGQKARKTQMSRAFSEQCC